MSQEAVGLILTAWSAVATFVAAGHASQFTGRDKEKKLLRKLREYLEQAAPDLSVSGPDFQVRFGRWEIDLVCDDEAMRLAVEGKYKVLSDGAVPDNRKAAFFDLYKLENYVDSGEYARGLFLWLTDERNYLVHARGDSQDFSTHQGRVYEPGTRLRATRSRSGMPVPLILKGRYEFNWETVHGSWYSLVLPVSRNAPPSKRLNPPAAGAMVSGRG